MTGPVEVQGSEEPLNEDTAGPSSSDPPYAEVTTIASKKNGGSLKSLVSVRRRELKEDLKSMSYLRKSSAQAGEECEKKKRRGCPIAK